MTLLSGFYSEHDKKVCCLGLTSLLTLPGEQLVGEALGRVFRATLDLLVAYKDQVAGLSLFLSISVCVSAHAMLCMNF